METGDDSPILLRLMFGEAAGTVQRAASPRLCLWSRAFQDWLEEREHSHSKDYRKRGMRAWRRLYTHCDRMPWDLRQADIAEHVEWMIAKDYKPNTISSDLSMLSNFYRWFSQKKLDPASEPSFNPIDGVPHPPVKSYTVSANILNRGEIEALLRILRADRSPLGLRDYAFIVARLNLGIPFRELQRLQWGQIKAEASGAQVRWHPEAEWVRLPDKVWKAIRTYLEESGRLPGITEGSFIFAGISNWPQVVLGSSQPKWSEKPLCNDQLLGNLKLYGRRAGISDEKLNFQTLRRTAIYVHLKKEDNLEQIQAFTGWRGPLRDTRFRVKDLLQFQDDQEKVSQESDREIEIPNRQPRLYQPGERYIHGFFAHSQPLEKVQAVLAEDIQGLDEQIAGLRALGRGLMERQSKAERTDESIHLFGMYTMIAGWLEEMLRAEENLAERGKEGTWADEFLAAIDKLCQDEGETLDREALMMEAFGSNPELNLAARHLREETATLRFLLRNTLQAAAEAEEDKTYLRMVELYGKGSVCLARLLRRRKANEGILAAYLRKLIDQAIEEVLAGWADW